MAGVEDNDASQKALKQVRELTGSKPMRGESLLKSRKLKRRFKEAKAKQQAKERPRSN